LSTAANCIFQTVIPKFLSLCHTTEWSMHTLWINYSETSIYSSRIIRFPGSVVQFLRSLSESYFNYGSHIYCFPGSVVSFSDPQRKRWIEVSLYFGTQVCFCCYPNMTQGKYFVMVKNVISWTALPIDSTVTGSWDIMKTSSIAGAKVYCCPGNIKFVAFHRLQITAGG
jgi:hypothetical protein